MRLISLRLALLAPIVGTLTACAASPSREHIEAAASRAVIERTIGSRARELQLELVADQAGREWYEVDSGRGVVTIKGSSGVALTRGAYAYLNTIGAASVSWEGSRVALPARFPDFDGPRTLTPFTHRAYLNVCTYGYTTPWWDWNRWEREIDWMALHGIDMPLAMEGQEFVWQALWRELGVTSEELAEYFSGPAFTPWQRMGNIEGHMQPLPQRWIESKRALQVRILDRMRALGMQPVLPAFGGYSQEIDLLLQRIVRAYEHGDIEHADANVNKLIAVVSQLDLLVGGQQETLSTWIDAAAANGIDAAEMRYYERNAKAQVTIWGGAGNLNDYASKAWQGLYKDFYLPRWTMFLAALKQSVLTKAPLDERLVRAEIAAWERAWVERDQEYERTVAPDTTAAVRALLARLEQP